MKNNVKIVHIQIHVINKRRTIMEKETVVYLIRHSEKNKSKRIYWNIQYKR